jgi:hypothetical protein
MPHERTSLFAATVIAAGVVAATVITSRAVVRITRIRHHDQTISVTGSARQRVRSDRAYWSARVNVQEHDLPSAYRTLAANIARVRAYLVQRGFPDRQVESYAVGMTVLRPRDTRGNEIVDQVLAYALTQSIGVETPDVDRVATVSRDVTELLREGISVTSDAPVYLYTRLAELKIRLIAAAARDARVRAEQIAASSHGRLTSLARGRMGVVQVNAANETNVSAEGVNDTASIDKDAMAVVSSVFYLE